MIIHGFFSKAGTIKHFLFSEKEWGGFTWLLKILTVYIAAAVIITLASKYTPVRRYLEPFLFGVSFPVYVLIIGIVLGVPAFNLCRAAVARFPSKGKGLPALLAILAAFTACAILPQIFLPRLLPVFTAALVILCIGFVFLLGCWGILKFVVRDIRKGIK